jgi:hypothetical protein
LSNDSHTSEFLSNEIKNVISSIGNEKFAAIVSDNAANVKKAREMVHEAFPLIQNVRCIAHCINLLAGDIVKHNFADKLLKKVNTLVAFFKNTAISGSSQL